MRGQMEYCTEPPEVSNALKTLF